MTKAGKSAATILSASILKAAFGESQQDFRERRGNLP